MFEWFTGGARAVVSAAVEQAGQLGNDRVGTSSRRKMPRRCGLLASTWASCLAT